MRRLLLIGLFLIPFATSAAAAADSPKALSPWVQKVLDRVETVIEIGGIADAAKNPQSPCEQDKLENIAERNVSLARGWITATTHLAQEAEFLRERTVCAQSDRMLLLQKLQQVMDKMTEATKTCDASQATVLDETFQFLTRAYLSFLQGSMDPTYKDDLLRQRYDFDTEEDPDPAAPLCPFTTDYGPHTIGFLAPRPDTSPEDRDAITGFRSYGCDKTVLERLPSSMQAEAEPLIQFMDSESTIARPIFKNIQDALRSLDALATVLSGGSASSGGGTSSVSTPPPHRSVSGCLTPEVSTKDSATFAEDIEALLAAYPGYFDPANQKPATGLTPSLFAALPAGALFLPSFDFFTSTANPVILLRRFVAKEFASGADRPLPQFLFQKETGDMIPMSLVGEMSAPAALRSAGADSQVMSGLLEAGSRDALERMDDLSLPLKNAVSSLTDTVENFLPKTYIPDVAYFMARSCVDGPCQKTLESVLQRSLNPYCHPYVSGRYRDQDSLKRCFCDPSIQSSWSDFDKYCSGDYKKDEYSQKQPTLIPACQAGGE